MNIHIQKFLFVFALLLSSYYVKAQTEGFDDVTVLARIHSVKDAEALTGYAISLEEENLTKVLSGLGPDDEVLLKGNIRYNPVTKDNKTEMHPTFYVNKIVPVSLKKLGEGKFQVTDPKIVFAINKSPSKPLEIPISGKVAGAMTLTASVLMMQNLALSGSQRTIKDQLEMNIFFTTGVLATGLFIWEQLQKTKDIK